VTDYGLAFRIIRAALDAKQTELAEAMGTTASTLSLIECGKRNPSLDMITRFSVSTAWPMPMVVALADGSVSKDMAVSIVKELLRGNNEANP